MYFPKKMDKQLDEWLAKDNRFPTLIVGIRQCGKTESVREFAKRNHLFLVEMNFGRTLNFPPILRGVWM